MSIYLFIFNNFLKLLFFHLLNAMDYMACIAYMDYMAYIAYMACMGMKSCSRVLIILVVYFMDRNWNLKPSILLNILLVILPWYPPPVKLILMEYALSNNEEARLSLQLILWGGVIQVLIRICRLSICQDRQTSFHDFILINCSEMSVLHYFLLP